MDDARSIIARALALLPAGVKLPFDEEADVVIAALRKEGFRIVAPPRKRIPYSDKRPGGVTEGET